MLEIQRFTGGIASTNAYLGKTAKGTFLVDAPEGAADWLASKGSRLEALLLTHAHFDHVLDAAAIHRGHGCPVFAFGEPTPDLTLEHFLGVMGSAFKVADYPVEKCLADGDTLELPLCGLRFAIAHIPGHSPDSITFALAEEGVVFPGDVLMAGGIGRCDFPGGNEAQLTRGIREKLYCLPDATRVLPGHGPASTIGEEKRSNPFVRA